MKKIVSSCLTVIMILMVASGMNVFALAKTFSGVVTYDGEEHNYYGTLFKVYVNSNKIETPIPPLVLENGRSIVAIREICEALGADVLWTQGDLHKESKILICKDNTVIELQLNNKTAVVNGESVLLETAPKLVAYEGVGKTMVPIRFVSETLNMKVEYHAADGIIYIQGKVGEVITPTPTPTPTQTPTPTPVPTPTPMPTQTTIPTQTPNALASVASLKNSGEETTLQFSEAVGTYNIMKLDNPKRLVFDFKGFNVDKLKSSYAVGGQLTQIRTGNFDGSARIVFDVNEFPEYEINISQDKKTAVITLKFENDNNNNNGGRPLVIIDAGHGGSDVGAIGRDENGNVVCYEKDVNLAIAKKVYANLAAAGVNVMYTRDSDVFWELDERTTFANSKNADLFVSIHCNALADTSVNGTLVMHHTSNEYSQTGTLLANNILKYLPDAWGTKNRGRLDGSKMYVIRKADMPSVIVENAFITNESDREKLLNDALQEKAAKAIVNGILDTLKTM